MVGPALPGATTSLVLAATDQAGQPCVLKVQFPHREAEHEAAALDRWHGNGAVRLLAHDPSMRALLLERCVPGTALAASPAGRRGALDVLAGLLPRLWVPVGAPFRTAADEALGWAHDLPQRWERARRPFERRLLDAAVDAAADLASTQGQQVLVHQDLHADNVLAAGREPWLVIDPKPLAAERELAVAPIVRGPELGHSYELVRRRLDVLTRRLGLDPDRARRWTVAQTVAWSIHDDRAFPRHLDVARWLLDP